jgi:hypothetical protein
MKELIKRIIREEFSEQGDLDMKILNFLRRRARVYRQNVADMEVVSVMFDGTDYGFNSLQSRKKMESIIIELLYSFELFQDMFDMQANEYNSYRQKIVKTIRYFLNELMKNERFG